MRSLIFSAAVALSLMGIAYAGDQLYMDEMDVLVYGRPVYPIEGFVPPIVADSDEGKTFALIPYLTQPTLRGPLSPKERIDAGHSAFDVRQMLDFMPSTDLIRPVW